ARFFGAPAGGPGAGGGSGGGGGPSRAPPGPASRAGPGPPASPAGLTAAESGLPGTVPGPSGAPQLPQKAAPSGELAPHWAQVAAIQALTAQGPPDSRLGPVAGPEGGGVDRLDPGGEG